MSESARRHLRLIDKAIAGEISLARLENLQRALLTEGMPVPASAPIATLNAEAAEDAEELEAILAALASPPTCSLCALNGGEGCNGHCRGA